MPSDTDDPIDARVNAAVQRALEQSAALQPKQIIKETVTTLDAEPMLKVFRDLLNPHTQCMDPQVIVTCRGEKRAFGRKSLKDMGYSRAASVFVDRFSKRDDWVEGSGSWMSSRTPPVVNMLASFCRPPTEEHTSGSPSSPPLHVDSTGWEDCIGNIKELEIILERQSPN
ncbi:hypothetical protein HGRIS_003075 [Hohenbuehelia grisea]|uniref:Rhodanese domain-containing protein n=1 Tax=Hohenbuehelia grisea TaxID=104357 RepID=A0ABR3JNR6_9AGAR